MVGYVVADCPECSFPISARPNEEVSCPSCHITGRISGVEIPTPLFWAAIAFIAGVIASPYLKKQLGRVG